MHKILLNPFCAIIISALTLGILKAIELIFYPINPSVFYQKNHGLELLTYALYGISLIIVLYCSKGSIQKNSRKTFFALLFLWLAALLREMGVQHWLTRHDTTAIKIRFFTNPNNPLHEKVISGILIIIVVGIISWLFFKYLRQIIIGLIRKIPLYWTIATFGFILLTSQFCDRFPSRYFKATKIRLEPDTLQYLKFFEEGGEACLPVLFALAFIQYSLLQRKNESLTRR